MIESIDAYQKLKAKVIAFAKKRQLAGKYVTWRATRRKFKMTYDEIENLICDSDGVLSEVVGIRVNGGIYEFRTKGEYQIEYCGPE